MPGQSTASTAFSARVAEVIGALQRSIRTVLTSFPDLKTSADLKRHLNLDTALAWQIFSLCQCPDPLASDRFIPKAGSMNRFMRAIQKHQVPPERCRPVRDAYTVFELFVSEQAGDRARFSAMLSALQPLDRSTWLKLRKAAFRANSGVWGVAVDASINCAIFHLRPTGQHDALSIRGRVGVRGFRPGASVAMSISTRTWGGGTPPPHEGQPADVPKILTSGGGLIEHACSTPLPIVESRVTPDGTFRDYLAVDGLGRDSETTAWWHTLSADFPGSTKPPHGCSCPSAEPTELQIVDLLVPAGWSDPTRIRSRCVGPDVRFSPTSVGGTILLDRPAEHLGQRLESLYSAAAPNYHDLVAEQLEQLGWNQTRFDIFRCTVKYPVLHSVTHVYVE